MGRTCSLACPAGQSEEPPPPPLPLCSLVFFHGEGKVWGGVTLSKEEDPKLGCNQQGLGHSEGEGGLCSRGVPDGAGCEPRRSD